MWDNTDFFKEMFNEYRENPKDYFAPRNWDKTNAKGATLRINEVDKNGNSLWKEQWKQEVVLYKDNGILTVEIPGFHKEEISCSEIDRCVVYVRHYDSPHDLVASIVQYMIDIAQFPYPVYELR